MVLVPFLNIIGMDYLAERLVLWLSHTMVGIQSDHVMISLAHQRQ